MIHTTVTDTPHKAAGRAWRFRAWIMVGVLLMSAGVVVLVAEYLRAAEWARLFGAIQAEQNTERRHALELQLSRVRPSAGDSPGNFALVLICAGGVIGLYALAELRSATRPHRRPARPASPSFADIGGMDQAKQRCSIAVEEILGLKKAGSGTRQNGILLYGPPGAGKTFFARALANEYGLRMVKVGVEDLTSMWIGEGATKIREIFDRALAAAPSLLFLDEIDAIAVPRESSAAMCGVRNVENVRGTNTLLQQIDRIRSSKVVLVAATNHIEALDKAVIREGRFDYHIQLSLPDHAERVAILKTKLKESAIQRLDLDLIARRTEGYSPARLKGLLDEAERVAQGGLIQTQHVLDAIRARMGSEKDQPGKKQTWDDLVLPEETLGQLRLIQKLLEQPELEEALVVDPNASREVIPRGTVFHGPPGTGKTSIARVLANEAACSFYTATASDLLSVFTGGSEREIAALFKRAREHRPAIIFIDEIDALCPSRGSGGRADDRVVNQFLAELDGFGLNKGLFVIGATNRLELLDPALLRGGRLSELVEIPLPTAALRERLTRKFAGRFWCGPLDYPALAARTEGWSPADIEALCARAARQALLRKLAHDDERPAAPARRDAWAQADQLLAGGEFLQAVLTAHQALLEDLSRSFGLDPRPSGLIELVELVANRKPSALSPDQAQKLRQFQRRRNELAHPKAGSRHIDSVEAKRLLAGARRLLEEITGTGNNQRHSGEAEIQGESVEMVDFENALNQSEGRREGSAVTTRPSPRTPLMIQAMDDPALGEAPPPTPDDSRGEVVVWVQPGEDPRAAARRSHPREGLPPRSAPE